MLFLDAYDFCSDPNLQPLWNIVGLIIKIIWFGVPILLIIYGLFDLGKAVIAQKDDEVGKNVKRFFRRVGTAVCVFLVVWFVTFALNTATKIIGTNPDGEEIVQGTKGWKACWNNIMK